MLSVLFLVPLTLCHAQWPLQSIGYEVVQPIPRPPDQPGYPYDDVPHFAEMPNNPSLKLPENTNQNANGSALRTLKFSNGPATLGEAKKVGTANSNINNMKAVMLPGQSVPSKLGENANLMNISAVREEINKLLDKEPALRNSTDLFMEQFNLLYLNLADNEGDNEVRTENVYKYGMSVILRFLFEFYKIFRKLTSQSTQLQITNGDVYGVSYDRAVSVMKQKREYSPLQISAPVRRSADIFKSILYESVAIVQTKCNAWDVNWKCIILYLADLISEAANCSNVWYHALIHMLALETKIGVRDSLIYKIADLNNFKESIYFDNVFDFIIDKLQEYREVGRIQLTAEAVFFTMLADLQENGLLDCIFIGHLYD